MTQTESNDQLLCRLITRLTIATRGLNSGLDPLLGNIHKLLAKGIVDVSLKGELEQMCDALLNVDIETDDLHSADNLIERHESLSKFLEFCSDSEEQKKGIKKLLATSINNNRELNALDCEKISTILKPQLVNGGEAVPINEADTEYLRSIFSKIVDLLEIPQTLDKKLDVVRSMLKNKGDDFEIHRVLDGVVNILEAIQQEQKRERNDFHEFLQQLSSRLSDLGDHASKLNHYNQAGFEGRAQDDDALEKKLATLKMGSENATDFVEFRKIVSEHLAVIEQQLQTNKAIEQSRQLETEKEIDRLVNRMQEMELEANELHVSLKLAHNQAIRDSLTGMYNRMAYDDKLQQELIRWKRFGKATCLLVWDIDHFKKINDQFGHNAGDKTLVAIGRILQSHCRESDFVARYGGEEFVMLLVGADQIQATAIAEKTRKAIAACAFNSQGERVPVTVSCGLAEFSKGDDPEAIFERADKALYQAKESGRNRCCVFEKQQDQAALIS